MVKHILEKLISKTSLTESESYNFMKSVMMGKVTDIQLSGILIALRVKKENSDEVTGFARAMREKMIKIDLDYEAIDMCGTGGDYHGTFNISTAACFVTAGAGVKIAKHGNKAISSSSGSANVLESLGIDINKSVATSKSDMLKYLQLIQIHKLMVHYPIIAPSTLIIHNFMLDMMVLTLLILQMDNLLIDK